MPTPAQVANRRQDPPGERHYTATVTTAGTPAYTVALDPGGAATEALALTGATYVVGDRILLLVTAIGNFILGKIGA